MIGTIILWVVVMWLVSGVWGAHQLRKNEYYMKYANESLDRLGMSSTECKVAWCTATVLFILIGPFVAKAAIKLSKASEEDIKKIWEDV